MRRSIWTVSLGVLLLNVAAQPVLTANDAPSPGGAFLMRHGSIFSGLYQVLVVNTGQAAEWNVFGVAFDTVDTWSMVPPADVDDAGSFPMATCAHVFGTHPMLFDSVSASAVHRVGQLAGTDTVRLFSDPMQVMVFPCGHGSSWTDIFAWSEAVSSRSGFGVIHDTADGYGQLHLPGGWEGEVLGTVRTITTQLIDAQDTAYDVSLERRFLQPGYPLPIARVWEVRRFMTGDTVGITVDFGVEHLEASQFTGLAATPEVDDLAFVFRPGELEILHPSHDINAITVHDGQGRVCSANGPGVSRMALNALSIGHYTARIELGDGRVKVIRFVVP